MDEQQDDWCKCDLGVQVPFHAIPLVPADDQNVFLCCSHCTRYRTLAWTCTRRRREGAWRWKEAPEGEKVFRGFYTFDSVAHLATWDGCRAAQMEQLVVAPEIRTSTFSNWNYHYNSWGYLFQLCDPGKNHLWLIGTRPTFPRNGSCLEEYSPRKWVVYGLQRSGCGKVKNVVAKYRFSGFTIRNKYRAK